MASPSTGAETQSAPHLTTEQWQDAVKHASAQAFQTGHVQGELYGRRSLAAEIERDFAPDGSRQFTAEDARTMALKQVH